MCQLRPLTGDGISRPIKQFRHATKCVENVTYLPANVSQSTVAGFPGDYKNLLMMSLHDVFDKAQVSKNRAQFTLTICCGDNTPDFRQGKNLIRIFVFLAQDRRRRRLLVTFTNEQFVSNEASRLKLTFAVLANAIL